MVVPLLLQRGQLSRTQDFLITPGMLTRFHCSAEGQRVKCAHIAPPPRSIHQPHDTLDRCRGWMGRGACRNGEPLAVRGSSFGETQT